MSSDAVPAIDVRGVGKRYRLGSGAEGRMADALQRWARKALRRNEAATREEFWALRDVSLQIQPGEVVGIIGRNGAGKSTLLKLLTRITPPTEGEIVMRGRVASLLEVGAGFDPELSGRENVFLSGAILGMSGQEIRAKFDEIVAFSGIERFIDTPVKRYSSGMFVRLAFAVGAHLDSDILLIDEVLAVGDAEFQNKCLGKMESVSAQGRTIVFISHNLLAVQRLCPRAYLFDAGQVRAEGPTSEVIAQYLDTLGAKQEGAEADVSGLVRPGNGRARLQRVALVDGEGRPTDRLLLGQPVEVVTTWQVNERIPDAMFQIGVSLVDGIRAATAHSTDRGGTPAVLEPGLHRMRAQLGIDVLPGDFMLDVALYHANEVPIDHLDGALRFRVANLGADGEDRYPIAEVRGAVRPPSTWSVAPVAAAAQTPSS